jgi:hypothetical protein
MRPRRVAGTPSAPRKVTRPKRTPAPNPTAGNSQLSPRQTEPVDAPSAPTSSPNQAGATPLPSVRDEVDAQAEGPSLTPGEDPKDVSMRDDPVPDMLGEKAPDPAPPPDKPPDANPVDTPEPGASNLPPPDPGDPLDPFTGPDPIVVATMHESMTVNNNDSTVDLPTGVPLGAPITPEPPPPDGDGVQHDPPDAINALGTAVPPPPPDEEEVDIETILDGIVQ